MELTHKELRQIIDKYPTYVAENKGDKIDECIAIDDVYSIVKEVISITKRNIKINQLPNSVADAYHKYELLQEEDNNTVHSDEISYKKADKRIRKAYDVFAQECRIYELNHFTVSAIFEGDKNINLIK